MKIIADDGREFRTVEEAQAYELAGKLKKKIEAEVEELNKDISQLEDLGYEIWMTDKDGVLSINARSSEKQEDTPLARMLEEMFR